MKIKMTGQGNFCDLKHSSNQKNPILAILQNIVTSEMDMW